MKELLCRLIVVIKIKIKIILGLSILNEKLINSLNGEYIV